MPTYYFHLKSSKTDIPDKLGREFDDVQIAMLRARYMMRKVIDYSGGAYERDLRVVVEQPATDEVPFVRKLVILFPKPLDCEP